MRAHTAPTLLCTLALALALVRCNGHGLTFGDARLPSESDATAADARTHAQAGERCVTGSSGELLGTCADALCLSPTEGFPGGYCAAECVNAPCRDDEQCVPLTAQRRVCLRACARDADCRVREGYVCRAPTPRSRPVCIANGEPLGRRDDGAACFDSSLGDAGVSGSRPLAPLARVHFTGPDRSLSREAGLETAAEAEPSLAVRPDGGGFAVSFVGYDARAYWRAAVVFTDAHGAPSAPLLALHDRDYPDVLTPAIAYDPAGVLHVVYVANNTDRPGNALRYTRVDRDGALREARSVLDDARCNAGCAETAISVGLDARGASRVYAATLARVGDGSTRVLLASAPVESGVFAPPVVLAEGETVVGARRVPSFLSLAAGPEPGLVAAAWIAANRYEPLAPLGSSANRVRLRTSRDGGVTWGPVREVSRPVDAAVEQVPWVATAAGVLYVAYVSGGLDGRWSVWLATSRDGGASFAHRAVHDDPEPCATHAFVGLGVDGADASAHVAWLENRFGPGAAVYTRCPVDGGSSCMRNEQVSREPFVFSTTVDASRWHGTRSALAVTPAGAPVFAWSDTRSGGPGVYLSLGAPSR